jgi:hypothetical protein
MNTQTILQDQLKRIDDIIDSLGMPIDTTIRSTIAVLWAHGFVTDASCGGHGDRRTNGPYVWISSKTAENLELLRVGALRAGRDKEATELGEKVKRANLKDRERLLEFLGEFYMSRTSSQLVRLHTVSRGAFATTLLWCQGSEIVDCLKNDEGRREWLKNAQAEFNLFTNFLLEKLQ